jgi:precorrin-6A/cobalt-precorrin-6A reductase
MSPPDDQSDAIVTNSAAMMLSAAAQAITATLVRMWSSCHSIRSRASSDVFLPPGTAIGRISTLGRRHHQQRPGTGCDASGAYRELVKTVLLLAGTTEATQLAETLVADGVDVLSSLAGVTAKPARRAGRTRSGGFGGVEGLIRHLREHPVDAVVDATHPFAAVMPFNAAAACAATGTPSCRVIRPAWEPVDGDRWIDAADLPAAAEALAGLGARRVLLTVGRQSTWAFADLDAWFLIRAIEPPDVVPVDHELLLTRGPFDVASEAALLHEHAIDAVVTKNAGGKATAAKLHAARLAGVPVVMVQRPPQPEVTIVDGVEQAVAWLAQAVR